MTDSGEVLDDIPVDFASGPVDYAVIEFPIGADPSPMAVELLRIAEGGAVSLFDVELLMTDAEGNASKVDLADPAAPAALSVLAGAQSGLFTDHDLSEAGAILAPERFALLVAYENTWASGFVAATHGIGGDIVASDRVPASRLLETLDSLVD